MTQCERLLVHLQNHGHIDPMTAWERLGIYRLGARVYDLKELGHEIVNVGKVVQNRFGEDCHVADYHLIVGEQKQ